jgi:signal peptidase II
MKPQPSDQDNTTPSRAWRHAASVVPFLLVTILLLSADLFTKWAAFDRVAGEPVSLVRDESGRLAPMPAHDAILLIPKVLALHLTANEGAVFGLGRGGRWIFIAFSLIASAVIVTIFGRSDRRTRGLHLALAAVLAGALGNLYDRLRFGVVRDMLLLFPGVKLPFGWHWPNGSDGLYPWIFNVADACLVIGLFFLMIIMYRHERKLQADRKR